MCHNGHNSSCRTTVTSDSGMTSYYSIPKNVILDKALQTLKFPAGKLKRSYIVTIELEILIKLPPSIKPTSNAPPLPPS